MRKRQSVELAQLCGVCSPSIAAEGDTIAAELMKLTGLRTFPNVFIGGKHIGGNDSTQALNRSGALKPALRAAGALKA